MDRSSQWIDRAREVTSTHGIRSNSPTMGIFESKLVAADRNNQEQVSQSENGAHVGEGREGVTDVIAVTRALLENARKVSKTPARRRNLDNETPMKGSDLDSRDNAAERGINTKHADSRHTSSVTRSHTRRVAEFQDGDSGRNATDTESVISGSQKSARSGKRDLQTRSASRVRDVRRHERVVEEAEKSVKKAMSDATGRMSKIRRIKKLRDHLDVLDRGTAEQGESIMAEMENTIKKMNESFEKQCNSMNYSITKVRGDIAKKERHVQSLIDMEKDNEKNAIESEAEYSRKVEEADTAIFQAHELVEQLEGTLREHIAQGEELMGQSEQITTEMQSSLQSVDGDSKRIQDESTSWREQETSRLKTAISLQSASLQSAEVQRRQDEQLLMEEKQKQMEERAKDVEHSTLETEEIATRIENTAVRLGEERHALTLQEVELAELQAAMEENDHRLNELQLLKEDTIRAKSGLDRQLTQV